MLPPDDASDPTLTGADEAIAQDPIFQKQVQRLHHFTVYSRWLIIVCLWLVLLPLSVWGLRSEIGLWRDHFTWTAVRYALIYHRLPAMGLGVCIGMPVAVLIWQSRNILMGLSPAHQRYLHKQVLRIRQQGKSHPLWQWICEPQDLRATRSRK
ncbi:MAG TPA: hypothetical protein V6C57_02750 [Coleofasciculaceae cyanobacterium]